MTILVQRLIREAGFSNTYERERLVTLCQLVVKVCVEEYGQNELSDQTAQRILTAFGIAPKD